MRSAGNDSYRPEGCSLKVEASECGLMLQLLRRLLHARILAELRPQGTYPFHYLIFPLQFNQDGRLRGPF
ncbi:MAG TPA: hypothetical protein PLR22_09190 [Saprospiraceae bacterium]|nr:hypothetical protein [Saprospiraceae bacterium]